MIFEGYLDKLPVSKNVNAPQLFMLINNDPQLYGLNGKFINISLSVKGQDKLFLINRKKDEPFEYYLDVDKQITIVKDKKGVVSFPPSREGYKDLIDWILKNLK